MRRKSSLPPLSQQVSDSRYCFLSTSTAPTQGLRLLMAGREVCREEYQVTRDGYPSLALELVVAGSGTLELAGKNSALLPGVIFSYGPDVPHSIRNKPGGRLVKYFVDFVGEEGMHLLKIAGMTPGKVAGIRNAEPLITSFELLLNRGDRVSKSNAELCADLLRVILRMSVETVPIRPGLTLKDDCCSRAIALIDKEYEVIRSISEVAGRLGVTAEHLSRTFRKMGEVPPSKRLSLKKLTQAAGLLLSGEWKVKEVAYRLGYATPFHFSSVFRRHFGYSPRALQRQMRGAVTAKSPRRKKLSS